MNNELGTILQPHMGRTFDNYKPGDSMDGTMTLGKVTKVHHKSATVDVQLLSQRGAIAASGDKEGQYACKVLTTSAHFNRTTMSASGMITPIQEGEMVVVAFLDQSKNKPIIIGSMHNTWENDANVLTTDYPIQPTDSLRKLQESTKALYVHPSQFYEKIDGVGGVETSHPSKSFLKVDAHQWDVDDSHLGFDHGDLTEKDKVSKDTLSAHTEESALPIRLLAVHRSSYNDEDTTWTKIFLDESGMLRFTRDNNDDKLSYLELGTEGDVKIRRQLDSALQGFSQDFSEVSLGLDGDVSLVREQEGNRSTITVTEDNEIEILHHSGSTISFSNNGDIVINPKGRTIMSKVDITDVTLNDVKSCNLRCTNNI